MSHSGILVVEDDAIVRAWVRESLKSSEFRVDGEAATGEEALRLMERRRPALLLVDHRLPDGLGTSLVRELRLRGFGAPAVLMTAATEPGLNEDARDAGIQVTIHKRGRPEELLEGLRRAAAGLLAFESENLPRQSNNNPLTARERDVLRLVAEGATNAEIAAALEIGRESVKTLLGRLFEKLGVHRRAHAVAAAKERGLL